MKTFNQIQGKIAYLKSCRPIPMQYIEALQWVIGVEKEENYKLAGNRYQQQLFYALVREGLAKLNCWNKDLSREVNARFRVGMDVEECINDLRNVQTTATSATA